MFSTSFKAVLVASWLLLSVAMADPNPKPSPTVPPQSASPTYTGPRNALTAVGCFSTPEPMADQGSYTFQSKGNCQPVCLGLGMPVMGLVNGTNCWCGTLIPPTTSVVDNSTCNTPCAGYDQELCGGDNVWWVYLTGLNKNKIANLDPSSLTGTSGSPTTKTSTSSLGASTVVVTATHAPGGSGKSSGGSSTVGIAVGVVVGVVAITGIVIGVLFFLRQKRRREVEEEYKRQASVNQFVSGGHKNNSSINDSRLDPDILQRRESTGSIADNQDYSRRILKVRNPDDF